MNWDDLPLPDSYKSAARVQPDAAEINRAWRDLIRVSEEWTERPLHYRYAILDRTGSLYPAPYVPIRLRKPSGELLPDPFHALVDTGATVSAFGYEFLEILGLSEADCQAGVSNGAGGTFRSLGYRPGIEAKVAGYPVRLRGNFSPGAGVVLGREDFLRAFTVHLDQRNYTLRLEPHADTEPAGD